MNIQTFSQLTIAGLVLSFFSIPWFSQGSNAEITGVQAVKNEMPRDRITFYCGEIIQKNTGEKIPTTMAYVPQRQANVPIVAWKSQHLAAWNPQRRCQIVSPKFQAFYEDGRLNYLSQGENAGYPIICALLNQQEECSGENQLFQIRPGSNTGNVIAGLNDILEGKSSEPIYQSSGDRIYISVSKFLENAPSIEMTSN